MRIVILTAQTFFTRSESDVLADGLRTQLEQRGHAAEVVRVPFSAAAPDTVLSHMAAARLLKLQAASPDLVIGLTFPAYLVPYPGKTVWLLRRFESLQALPDTPEARRVHELVVQADRTFLAEAREVYTASEAGRRRLLTDCGVPADGVLYPPVVSPALYRCETPERYVVCPLASVPAERVIAAIEAMRTVRAAGRLVLTGECGSAADWHAIQAKIEASGRGDKVTTTGTISESAYVDIVARATACLCLSGEDVPRGMLEAFHAGKPVVAFGGTPELLEHGVNGLIAAPSPEGLAEALDSLWAQSARTGEMAAHAAGTAARHNIDWETVVGTLLS